ncbi:MAG: hypothetical protein KAU14_04150 [Thermoplasmata archaeon]|nr:hypothetical protein [Thermoplasmata archaeon]
MVMRTIEMKEICIDVPSALLEERVKRLRGLFGERFKIEIKKEGVSVSGDLHNHKIRNKIIDILRGE